MTARQGEAPTVQQVLDTILDTLTEPGRTPDITIAAAARRAARTIHDLYDPALAHTAAQLAEQRNTANAVLTRAQQAIAALRDAGLFAPDARAAGGITTAGRHLDVIIATLGGRRGDSRADHRPTRP